MAKKNKTINQEQSDEQLIIASIWCYAIPATVASTIIISRLDCWIAAFVAMTVINAVMVYVVMLLSNHAVNYIRSHKTRLSVFACTVVYAVVLAIVMTVLQWFVVHQLVAAGHLK